MGGDVPPQYFLTNLTETPLESMSVLEVGRGSSSQVECPVYEPGTAIRWEEERTHTHAQPKFMHACTHVGVRGAFMFTLMLLCVVHSCLHSCCCAWCIHVYTHVVVRDAYMFTLILLCVVHTCLHSFCCAWCIHVYTHFVVRGAYMFTLMLLCVLFLCSGILLLN